MVNYNKIPRGFRSETHLPKPNGIYMGLVRRNFDSQRMGRLLVWISDFGPDKEEYWLALSYASPFAGSTPVQDTVKNGKSEDDSQKSYGFWATPPDVDNQVLCCFLDGDIANGFWFACVYPQNMNHMVPGIGWDNPSTDSEMDSKFAPYGPPVVEYNKNDTDNSPNASPTSLFDKEKVNRPVFTPLANGLIEQGLMADPERGVSNTSARRESPSRVFGLLSPRGNSIHIDDGPVGGETENEFIRLRTRSGVQLLIHETSGYIYMITKDGKSWVEISDGGIDMYSAGPISLASDADVNISAGGRVGIHGTAGLFMTSDENLSAYSKGPMGIVSGKELLLDAVGDIGLKSSRDVAFDAVRDVSENAGRNILAGACGYVSRNGKMLLDNSGGQPPVEVPHAQFEQDSITRQPTHEPFAHAFSSNTADPTGVDAAGNPTTTVTDSSGDTKEVPVSANKGKIMMFLYKKFKSFGWTSEGARTMVAQIGRENDYNPKFMFGTHTDGGANSKTNVGITSWQGSRRTALLAYLKTRGCIDSSGKLKSGWTTLEAQCEFMNKEMQSSYSKSAAAVRDPARTYYKNIEDVTSRNYVGWAKGGSRNGRFSKADSDRALKKMNGYYNTIKNATKTDE